MIGQCWWVPRHENVVTRVVEQLLELELVDNHLSFMVELRIAHDVKTVGIHLSLVDIEGVLDAADLIRFETVGGEDGSHGCRG